MCALCNCIISLIFVTHVRARGPQELGGPGSLNRLNPRFLHHWNDVCKTVIFEKMPDTTANHSTQEICNDAATDDDFICESKKTGALVTSYNSRKIQ